MPRDTFAGPLAAQIVMPVMAGSVRVVLLILIPGRIVNAGDPHAIKMADTLHVVAAEMVV